jgi:hypothetical protein
MDRWPGRGVIDREGGPHVDNLLRLVEIKFPGDDWGPGAELWRRVRSFLPLPLGTRPLPVPWLAQC